MIIVSIPEDKYHLKYQHLEDMPKEIKYPYVRAWLMIQNDPIITQAYIDTQVEHAIREEAPPRALYRGGTDYLWTTFDQLPSPELKQRIQEIVNYLLK